MKDKVIAVFEELSTFASAVAESAPQALPDSHVAFIVAVSFVVFVVPIILGWV